MIAVRDAGVFWNHHDLPEHDAWVDIYTANHDGEPVITVYVGRNERPSDPAGFVWTKNLEIDEILETARKVAAMMTPVQFHIPAPVVPEIVQEDDTSRAPGESYIQLPETWEQVKRGVTLWISYDKKSLQFRDARTEEVQFETMDAYYLDLVRSLLFGISSLEGILSDAVFASRAEFDNRITILAEQQETP